jgi:hypothetical protein
MEVTDADCIGATAGCTGSAGDAGLAGTCPKCAASCVQFSQSAAAGTSNQTHSATFRRFGRDRGEIESSALINDSRYSSGDFP